MASTNNTPLINTLTSSEEPRFRSRSPVVISRLAQTYPILDQAIKGEEIYQELWSSHQPQLFNEIKALAEAHIDSESTIEELRKSLADLSNKAQEYEVQYGELLSQKHDLTKAHAHERKEKDAVISALSTRPLNGGSQATLRTPFHPDPLEFSGEDPTELPAFLRKLQLKLRMNSDWWISEQQRMGYVISLLSSKAYNQVAHGINDDGTISHPHVKAITDILTTTFGDLNAKASAAKRLITLEQGKSPMDIFLPDWVATAKATKWDDIALIDHLKNAIHLEVLNRISYLRDDDIPQDLPRYIELIRRCDYEIRQANPDYFKKKKPSNHVLYPSTPNTQPSVAEGGDAMDLSATSTTPPIIWQRKDIENRRRPKTDAEREARRTYCTEYRLCHWCTSPKHSSPNCTTAPWAAGKA